MNTGANFVALLPNPACRRVQGLDATAARSFVALHNRLQHMGIQVRQRFGRHHGSQYVRHITPHLFSSCATGQRKWQQSQPIFNLATLLLLALVQRIVAHLPARRASTK